MATDCGNAWRPERLVVFISACARIVGTSDAVTVLRVQHASKHSAQTGHPIITSFEPVRIGFFDYEEAEDDPGVFSCFRRIRIQKISPHLDPQEGCQPLGIAPTTSCPLHGTQLMKRFR